MDQKDRARHSVAQTREHLALVAEELARRASVDWVKQQAKLAATHTAKDAVKEARVHPFLVSAIAAGLGAAAIFSFMRKRQKHARAEMMMMSAPYYHALPVRAPAAFPKTRKAVTSRATKVFGALKQGGSDAFYALQHARHKKAWVDRYLAPLVGAVVVGGAIAGAISQIMKAKALAGSSNQKYSLEAQYPSSYPSDQSSIR